MDSILQVVQLKQSRQKVRNLEPVKVGNSSQSQTESQKQCIQDREELWGAKFQGYLAHKNPPLLGPYRSPMPRNLW